LQHAFRGGDFVHGVEVDLAQLFDVDGSAVLGQSVSGREGTGRTEWGRMGCEGLRTLSVLW
jgi:hypothetical protein